jgi:hypothetical protein
MVRRMLYYTLALALLAVLALPRSVSATHRASGLSPTPSQNATESSLSRTAWRVLTNFWSAAGCIIDPSGLCAANQGGGSTVPGSNAGCIIDPNGRCASNGSAMKSFRGEEGCILDPNGRCAASPR